MVFPGAELEKLDLSAFLLDGQVPEEVRQRVNLAVEIAHQENTKRVRALDQKVRSLYSTAASLANDTSEALAGYRRLISTLNVRQQVFLKRHSGSFVRPTASPPKLKPGAKPVPFWGSELGTAGKEEAAEQGQRQGSPRTPCSPRSTSCSFSSQPGPAQGR